MLSSSAGIFPGVSGGEHGLGRSSIIFGLPLPKVLLFSVTLSEGSGKLGLSVSIGDVPLLARFLIRLWPFASVSMVIL